MSSSEHLRHVCRLRIAVAYLGERSQFGWWKSSFLTPTGWRFLERVFPRTSRSAGVESAGEAAKRVHDEAIGRGGVIHLFRFGEEFEERLHETLMSFSAGEIESLCSSSDSARAFLSAEYPGEVPPALGSVQVGLLESASKPEITGAFARHYWSGFVSGNPVFPYLR